MARPMVPEHLSKALNAAQGEFPEARSQFEKLRPHPSPRRQEAQDAARFARRRSEQG